MHKDAPLRCVFFLLTYTMNTNVVLTYTKLLAFAFLLGTLEIFPLFTAGSSRTSCTSTRRASATNTVCKDVDIVCKHLVTLKHILK
jgi:hypothetical protein